MYYTVAIAALSYLVLFVSADFIIANTTACYGDFFVGSCNDNVQVISPGVSFDEDFTCSKLHKAQDTRYIKTNTAGPNATTFTSTSDVCGAGQLYFARNYTSDAVNGTFNIYKGTDASGDSIGTCEYSGTNVTDSKRRCTQWLGTIFFEGLLRCNTTVCGYVAADYTSSSTSSTTTTSTSTNTTSTAAATTTTDPSSGTTTATTTTDSSSSTGTATTTDSTTSGSSSAGTMATSTSTDSTSSETSSATSSSTDETSSTAAAKRTAMGKRWIG